MLWPNVIHYEEFEKLGEYFKELLLHYTNITL